MISRGVANGVLIAAVAVWMVNIALSTLDSQYDQSQEVNTVVLAIIGGLLVTRPPRNGNGNGNDGKP
jgi:hypothetical protein